MQFKEKKPKLCQWAAKSIQESFAGWLRMVRPYKIYLIGIALFVVYALVSAETTTTEDAVEIPPGCWCTCGKDNVPLTDEELIIYRDKLFIQAQKNLLLDKTTLSSTKRLKYSAPDNRILSKTFGYTGLVSLVLVFMVLLWMDSTYIHKFATSLGLNINPKIIK
ncbi:hypothetical protein Btru_076164 [Bulinus truncatus]|nr:hypothetical protein Btru_076164 [Bulinus truncatus]